MYIIYIYIQVLESPLGDVVRHQENYIYMT